MRYLGIDYGERRIGVAAADEEVRIAIPRGVIRYQDDAQAIGEIASLVKEAGAVKVIMGVPLAHDGADTQESRIIRAFAAKLQTHIGIPIAFENEIFTTRMAEATGAGKKSDASAAAIILQSYLDKKSEARSTKHEIRNKPQ